MKKLLNKSTIFLLLIVMIATGAMALSSKQVRDKGNEQLSYYINANNEDRLQRFDERIMQSLFSQTMTGYFEVRKENDPAIEPYDVFITTKKEESNEKALRKSLSDYYSSMLFNPNIDGIHTLYHIQDMTTGKFISNADATQNLSAFLNNSTVDSTLPWYIMFTFDGQGNININTHSFSSAKFTEDPFSSKQVLLDLYNTTLKESKGYMQRSELGETSTNLVKNATFIFAIDQNTINYQNSIDSSTVYYYDTYTGYAKPICCAILFFMILATFLSPIIIKEIPFYRFIRRIPYEAHVIFTLSLITYLFESYHILYGMANTFLSLDTFLLCIPLGLIYLYIAILCLFLKESYTEKMWKPYFIVGKVGSFMIRMDMSKKDSYRTMLLVFINFLVVLVLIFMQQIGVILAILYSVLIYFIAQHYLSKTQKDYKALLDVTKDISTGDFNREITTDLGIFNDFKNDIVDIRANFKHALEEEVHSQKMKTELISNVSHDLKTPLTSIITYTDLLKKEDISEKERKKYLHTLDRNAIRLKHLIEDLFEVSKANSGNIKLEKIEIDICSLMRQVQVELADKLSKIKLDIRNDFSSEKILCVMDPQKTYRIFENLLSNIAKYAMPSTRVYINIEENDNGIEISLRNISANELNFKAEDITERFMRGDKSRNTEGSGLGLAIAKTFCELHDGKFDIYIDGDLFKVLLRFPKTSSPTQAIPPQE